MLIAGVLVQSTKGGPAIYGQTNSTLRLLGSGFNTTGARIVLVEEELQLNDDCDDFKDTDPFYLNPESDSVAMVSVVVALPSGVSEKTYYFCIKSDDDLHYMHQGTSKWLTLAVRKPPATTMLPLPLQVITLFFSFTPVCFSKWNKLYIKWACVLVLSMVLRICEEMFLHFVTVVQHF